MMNCCGSDFSLNLGMVIGLSDAGHGEF
jgi:hypothetical protein